MDYQPRCAISTCRKVITKAFLLCAKCEDEYGRRVEERPEWVNYLVNEEAKARRYHWGKVKRSHETSYEDIETVLDSDHLEYNGSLAGVSYTVDYVTIVEYRTWYEGYIVDAGTSDEYIFQDSDWEAVYSYGV